MVTNSVASAQEKKGDVIHWSIGGWLPQREDGSQHLGLAGAVAGRHKDVLLVAGGANFPGEMPWRGGAKQYHNIGYIFKVVSGKIEFTGKTFELPFNVAYSASCSTPFGVLTLGGENEAGLSDKVWLLSWNEGKQKVDLKSLPNLPFALTSAAVTVHGNEVFLAGGETVEGVSNTFMCFDLNNMNGQWKLLPSIPNPVSHAVMVFQSNGSHEGIYVLGGRKKNSGSVSAFYSSTWYFDIHKNRWIEKESLPFGLSAGTGISQGNRIFLLGGDRGVAFNKTEFLILATHEESDSAKRQQLINERIELQTSHPGFSKEVLMYDTEGDNWTTVGIIPFDSPVTTNAVRIDEDTFVITSGEIKAGKRTPQLLMGKFESE